MTTLKIRDLTAEESNDLMEDLSHVPGTEVALGTDLDDNNELTVETTWGDLAILVAKDTVGLDRISSTR